MPAPRNPQWRDGAAGNKFPFEDNALLVNAQGRAIGEDTFTDAAIYPAGGVGSAYISAVEVLPFQVKIIIGDEKVPDLCSATYNPIEPSEELRIVDKFGRGAGMLITQPVELAVFSSWGSGKHAFLQSQTKFVAECFYPIPADMVLGFRLDDGSVVSGDVALVGEDGITMSCGSANEWVACGAEPTTPPRVIRINAIGDPLFLRKKCYPALFDTPRFVREIVFQKGGQNVFVGPGEFGNVMIAQAPIVSDETILRIRTATDGVTFEAVGEKLDGI